MSIGVVWAVGSTNKSKSLSGVSSPCAGESNTRTSLTRDLADLPAVQREDFGETHGLQITGAPHLRVKQVASACKYSASNDQNPTTKVVVPLLATSAVYVPHSGAL